MRSTWTLKFKEQEALITNFWKEFEKSLKKSKNLEKAAVLDAEKAITLLRIDVKAWNKIKDLYLPAK